MRQLTGVSARTAADNSAEALADTVPSHNIPSQDFSKLYKQERDRRMKCEQDLEALRLNTRPSKDFQELQKSLEEERGIREMAEKELSQRNIEVEDIRKRWKQVARELDKFRAQGQGFYQVTDHYLIDLATRLRYNIRSFAIQYFGGELHRNVRMERTDFWDRYMTDATPDYEAYLASPGRRPSIIQSFLWKVLEGQIFGRFLWAGRASKHVRNLCQLLRPRECGHEVTYEDDTMLTFIIQGGQSEAGPESRPDPEAERKFQMWSATTIGLLFDSIDVKEESEAYNHTRNAKEYILEGIRETIDPFLWSQDEGYQHQILGILDNALALDKEISRQVARVDWVFGIKKTSAMFDPTAMELEKGEKPSMANQQVLLVVAPAMKKRGKSTGEDFKVESMLLRMEVSCEPVTSMV